MPLSPADRAKYLGFSRREYKIAELVRFIDDSLLKGKYRQFGGNCCVPLSPVKSVWLKDAILEEEIRRRYETVGWSEVTFLSFSNSRVLRLTVNE